MSPKSVKLFQDDTRSGALVMATNTSRSGLLLLLLFSACEMDPLNGGYKDLGKFSTKTQAQGIALKRVLDRFDKLPDDKQYKVRYSFDAPPNQRTSQAIWYNKTNQRLSVEVDIGSGTSCSWDKIDKNVLQTAVTAQRGLTSIDSLVRSAGVIASGCL